MKGVIFPYLLRTKQKMVWKEAEDLQKSKNSFDLVRHRRQ